MLQQPLQADLQHHLARPRRPAEAFFGRLKPFEKAADPEHHIGKARPKIVERVRDTGPGLARTFGKARIVQEPAAVAAGQEPVPVLAHARPHLGAFEILAQPFAGLNQIGTQEGSAIRALAPGQHGKGRFRQVDPGFPAPARIIRDLGNAPDGVLCLKGCGGLGDCGDMAAAAVLVDQALQRGLARRRDAIARDTPMAQATDPVLHRKGLGNAAVDDGGARLFTLGAGPEHHRLVHVLRHGQHGVGFTQAAQDTAGLAGDGGFVCQGGSERGGHVCGVLEVWVWDGTGRRERRQIGQRFVDKRVVAAGLDGADPPADGRGRLPVGARNGPDRQAGDGMGDVLPGGIGHPSGQPVDTCGRHGKSGVGRGRSHVLHSSLHGTRGRNFW